MKKSTVVFCILVLTLFIPLALFAQEETPITFRSLRVDWYEISSKGVKIQYWGFNNEAHWLYLPVSFERKLYRFVSSPSNAGNHGLPALLVRVKGTEVMYVDIYTRYGRPKEKIADFSQAELDKFAAVEETGRIELEF